MHHVNAAATAQRVQQAISELTLFHGVADLPGVIAFNDLLCHISASGPPNGGAVYAYIRSMSEISPSLGPAAPVDGPPLTVWQEYILDAIVFAHNAFSLQAEWHGDGLAPGLLTLASHDLRCLQLLYVAPTTLGDYADPLHVLPSLSPSAATAATHPQARTIATVKKQLAEADDWGTCAALLANYYQQVGAGLLGRNVAFRWDEHGGRGLRPIEQPEWVDLSGFIHYENERQAVINNTERFLAGLPAHNVLLYGERGTGKSATVKGLLPAFASAGLRMVEIPRHALHAIPAVLDEVRGRRHKIILFIDDLSFDDGDTAYKELKAVLEGSLEGPPPNVLVYATTNRRHLIQQNFADRAPVVDDMGDVRPQDTLQEKLSLADRFGMTVVFPSAAQNVYLDIVAGLAKQRGIDMATDQLRQQALQWANWHNGRSARTARQFIDSLQR